MHQAELKRQVGCAAAGYVQARVPPGSIIGVGTGSTTNCFIDALAESGWRCRGAVSSSSATSARLAARGIALLDLNDVETLAVYVDGADEIDSRGAMIKGGGGALTREKIVASVAETFVCIVDASKRVDVLGAFPLPIEVVPMARLAIGRRLIAHGGVPLLRVDHHGNPFVTDNGNEILDVKNLHIDDPVALENEINGWPGVLTVGLFARRHADLCLVASASGVQTLRF